MLSGSTYGEVMAIDRNDQLCELLRRRILVLDGAMGTMLQSLGLKERDFHKEGVTQTAQTLSGNNEMLSLTRPDVVMAVHNAYLESGADLIETNTFNANAISQSDYGTASLVCEMNVHSALLARRAADAFTAIDAAKPRFVVGSMGPTNRTASLAADAGNPGSRSVNFDTLRQAYQEQAAGLLDGGCDILLIETVFDTLNAKAAIAAIKDLSRTRSMKVPIWISVTMTGGTGRILSGQTLAAFWISISHANPLVIGLNCGFGPNELTEHIRELSRNANCFVALHPNAGFPDVLGHYCLTPGQMGQAMSRLAQEGNLNIAGGCCGTTPEHIKAICKAVHGLRPREVISPTVCARLSGLDPFIIKSDSPFVKIGERANMAGSRKFARLIREGDYAAAVDIARRQLQEGAQIIDVNVDEPLIDGPATMTTLLNYFANDPEISRFPIMIDSSQWETIEAGLKCLQGKGIVNSISLKDGEDEFLRRARLIRDYGAAMVVMAFDENGQADSFRRKTEICARAYRLLTLDIGIDPEDIIFDPNILAIGTGIHEHNSYAAAYIEACAYIRQNMPDSLISGGVSNLSFSFRGNEAIREAINSVFLFHATRAGMRMGIVNAGKLIDYQNLDSNLRTAAEDLVLNRHSDSLDRLLESTNGTSVAPNKKIVHEEWRKDTVCDRLRYAIAHGRADYIADDVMEALKTFENPLDIVHGPLAEGMRIVAEGFGGGKLFLPQVIKSAQTMKQAVTILEPFIETATGGSTDIKRVTVLLATVQGDIHDIGKNIVKIVLVCNGFRVIDLGVMVSTERLLETAAQEQVDVIGISGLITPSLNMMAQVAREMKRRGFCLPLLIGGAATSAEHTAVKIAAAYDGVVIHVKDASEAAATMQSLTNMAGRKLLVENVRQSQKKMQEKFKQKESAKEPIPLDQARRHRAKMNWADYAPARPAVLGLTTYRRFPLGDLVDCVNWTAFLKLWEFPVGLPNIPGYLKADNAARRLRRDARQLLGKIVDEELLEARAVVGLFPANSDGDDILIYSDDQRRSVRWRLPMLRQQRKLKNSDTVCYSLADFIAPVQSGVSDYIGAFAITAGLNLEKCILAYEQQHDDYRALMIQALADRLAEALSERLHEKVRRELWGYASLENSNPNTALSRKRLGIRPAPGYPACPDHSEKRTLFEMLQADRALEVRLTESCMMKPGASICGWYFSHPQARYFSVGPTGRDQIADYARRKNMSISEAAQWLSLNLAYQP